MTWAQLQRLLRAGGAVRPDETEPVGSSITVTGVAYDSRMVEPGHVFVALKGVRADGTAFLQAGTRPGRCRRRLRTAAASGHTRAVGGGC